MSGAHMNGLLFILIGSLGVAFAALILRADPRRHDNRTFFVLGLLDATMALFRGTAALTGYEIADIEVLLPCAAIAPFLGWASLEFAWSFPFNRPLPWRYRVPLILATLATSTLLVTGRGHTESNLSNALFFIPATIFMISFQVRNLRRIEGDRLGVKLVVAALMMRWITANIVYSVFGHVAPGTWSTILWLESSVAVLLSFVMIGMGSIRSNLFTMRSALGELAIESAFFLAGLGLTALALYGALEVRITYPVLGLALLLLASLIPLVVFAATNWLRPRVEAGVDPRRARRRELLDEATAAVTGDPAQMIELATRTLTAISDGGTARFLPLAALAAEDRAALVGGTRRDETALLVPVRTGAHLHGALEIHRGVRDRETVLAAELLADRLASACELRRLAGELEEASRLAALGSFAAAIAHDIRTPLTSVQMNVQILRRKVQLPPDDMEHFDIALEELRRLDDHVKELLDYAKPLALHRETVELKDVADDAARTIEPLLGERRQVLAREHSADVPPVAVDPTRLRQVLWNLLDNAAKASPDGATIALRTRRDGEKVAIDIVDHGSGIEANDLLRIFEPFFTTRPDGTGLGLAICQKVVRGHGGDIVVQSRPAEGSTFTIVLPAQSAQVAA
ncbi:MAG TPA: ATP-binding protein [Kofleriaceae bacterium]|nr:ATP-binding protein [Kofleriaceae bacterium]